MKFSYALIKKLAPGKYDEKTLAEKLNLMSFETVTLGGGILDISVPPNRFSDAASHLGVALETSVIFKSKLNDPFQKLPKFDGKIKNPSVKIQDPKLCFRYMAAYVSGLKIGPSPKWLKDVLGDCGLRSINNVVDIMNYVMLEIGQPMHAFDADKLKGGIVVRRAKKGEKIETIDNQKLNLDSGVLVIADSKQPIAIAGIKGGKSSEVSAETKNILVESASFNGVNIYKSSRKMGLVTDASSRFSHDLAPALAEYGMNRALALLQEIAGGKVSKPADAYPKKQSKKLLKLNIEKINKLIGYNFKEKELIQLFEKLGFEPVRSGKEKGLWRVPDWRQDINNIEDLAEEAARFADYNRLPAQPPLVGIAMATEEELLLLKDRIRNFLSGAGFNEVYNYSFLSEKEISNGAIPLVNPISNQFAYLRNSLAAGLSRNLNDNLRFNDEVRIFEIGKIFKDNHRQGGAGRGKVKETLTLGIGLASKNSVLEIKGLLDTLFRQLGWTDYFMPDFNQPSNILRPAEALRIETGDHQVFGYLGSLSGIKNGAAAEIDLEKLLKVVSGEKEFKPLSKYPAVTRDLSILVSKSVRVGELFALLQNISPKLIWDVDLIDFYEDPKLGVDKKSLTFRIVFQVDDRTLTDAEVDKEIAIIYKVLADRFDAEIR